MSRSRNKNRVIIRSPDNCFCSGHKAIARSALVLIIFLSLVKEEHFVFKRMVNILISPFTKFPFSLSSSKLFLNSSIIWSIISFIFVLKPSASSRFSSSSRILFTTYSLRLKATLSSTSSFF